MIETAREHAVASCLACTGCLGVLVLLAYEVGPATRLDQSILNSLNAPLGTTANQVAYAVEQLVTPLGQVALAIAAGALALALGRPRQALFALALVAGTAILVQLLKLALVNPRYQPIPPPALFGTKIYPWKNSFPSGNAAGALAIALAFVYVAPLRWQRSVAAVGLLFALAVGLCLPVINYHYPSDVLGGWLTAAAWFFALLALPRLTRSG